MASQIDKSPGAENAPNGPYGRWAAISAGAGALAEIPRAIQNTGTSGTVTVTGLDNVSATLYIAQGQVLAVRPRYLTAVGSGVVIIGLF
jgi:hypothetical protein